MAKSDKVAGTVGRAKAFAARLGRKSTPDSTSIHGPSPNPETNLAIADIALRGSTILARRAVEQALLGRGYAPRKAKAILKGRPLTETLLHGALARIALSSVPGAIAVGGGLIAKTLYDRTRARAAKIEGEAALAGKAEDGKASGK